MWETEVGFRRLGGGEEIGGATGVKGSGRGVSMPSREAGGPASHWARSACPRILGSAPARIRQAHPGQTMATYVAIGTRGLLGRLA